MDERGRVIRTSTVREEVTNSHDFVFVDGNAIQLNTESNLNDQENVEAVSSHEQRSIIEPTHRIIKPRRKHKKVLADSDCISSEILVYSER